MVYFFLSKIESFYKEFPSDGDVLEYNFTIRCNEK